MHSPVAVAFVGQDDQAAWRAVAFERRVEPLALHREGACAYSSVAFRAEYIGNINGCFSSAPTPVFLLLALGVARVGIAITCVIVGLAVDEQQRLLDLVRLVERAHQGVGLRSLPQSALLRLEPKGRQCPARASTHATLRVDAKRLRWRQPSHEERNAFESQHVKHHAAALASNLLELSIMSGVQRWAVRHRLGSMGAERAPWTTNGERTPGKHRVNPIRSDAGGPVVGAAASDAAGEQISAVSEQVCCHKSAI